MVVVADSAAAAEPLEVLRPDELVGEAASAVEAASAGVPVDTKVVDAPRVTAVKEAGAAPADPPAPAQDPTETQEEEQDATADGESPRPQAPAARENGGSSAGEGPSGRGGGGGGKSHSKIFVGGLTSQQDEGTSAHARTCAALGPAVDGRRREAESAPSHPIPTAASR